MELHHGLMLINHSWSSCIHGALVLTGHSLDEVIHQSCVASLHPEELSCVPNGTSVLLVRWVGCVLGCCVFK